MRLTEPAELSSALGIDFSDQQLAAITAPLEPAVIIAGAGTGKTTVMAARVVWLVGSGQVLPEQVLGLTFTRKSAGELANRVRQALHRAGVLAADSEAGEELILTYDSFAGRLVAEHGLRLGIEGDARLITGAARYRLAARVVADTPGLAYLSRLRPAAVTQRLLELSGELRSHLVEPLALADQAEAFDAAIEAAPRNPRGQVYQALQTARAAAAERLELATLVVR
ncbi:MAG: UvrD-helicase domain-containing protein, partial [Propionicimonas sp.]